MDHITTLASSIFGLAAGGMGLWAAWLWLKASQIDMPEYESPAASMDDAPALHLLGQLVHVNEIASALKESAALNVRAAKWTGCAALLGAFAAILSGV